MFALSSAGACEDPQRRNLFPHLPAFGQLIDEAFAAAGASPVREPYDDPEPSDAGEEPEASDGPAEADSAERTEDEGGVDIGADAQGTNDALSPPVETPLNAEPLACGCRVGRPAEDYGAACALFGALWVAATRRSRRRFR